MKANETKFQDLVATNYQYVVPLFQRPYSWTKKEWKQLLDDVNELVETNLEHFIGSIVTIPTPSVPAGVNKFLLIDGQQRMTTLFIILAVLRDRAQDEGFDELADEINDMVVNRHKKGDDHYKLMPTQGDREVYRQLINGTKPSIDQISESGLVSCYNYFKLQMIHSDVEAIFRVISNNLSIVSIVLDKDDNPHVVFESLNAKGRSLTQADLIRNFFFMRIHVDKHNDIYAQYWKPMQDTLDESMTEFIRHYLMTKGTNVRQPDVYQVLKQRTEEERADILAYLKQLARFSDYYRRILYPEKYENDVELRRRMMRFNRLQTTVAYPFLLRVYADVDEQKLTKNHQYEILEILENYIFRRAICSVPTNDLNKTFPSLYGWIETHVDHDFITGLRIELAKRRYPSDQEFHEGLIYDPLYGSGERRERTRFLLESLEQAKGHKEKVNLSDCTIEHIMPQTLNNWWRQNLGDEYEQDYETWVNTLGNLTLTAYNSELGDRPFPDKRQHYSNSHIELTRDIVQYSTWDTSTILERATNLANAAVEFWPDFRLEAVSSPEDFNGLTFNGTKPSTLEFLGQIHWVKTWRDVFVLTVTIISELAPDKMDALKEEFPNFLGSNPENFTRCAQLPNGDVLNVKLHANTIYRTCSRMIEFIELDTESWNVTLR